MDNHVLIWILLFTEWYFNPLITMHMNLIILVKHVLIINVYVTVGPGL